MDNYGNWRKSGHSSPEGQCVEAASSDGTVAVRDTVNRAAGHHEYGAKAWTAFTDLLKVGHTPGEM